MQYAFHTCNTLAETGLSMALGKLLPRKTPPVILCIGSDLAIGDSLGPIVGTLLKELSGQRAYVYGTLRSPVTAKEIRYLKEFLPKTHPGAPVIAVDAAVGERSELGLIKLADAPLCPGSGANKRLGKVGDISLLGIVGEKAGFSYSVLNLTRLHLVYEMAQKIAGALSDYLGGETDKNSQFAV